MTKTRLLAELEPRVKYLEDAPPPSSDVIRANYLLVGGGSGAPGGDGYSGHMGYGGVPGQIKTAETILDTKLNYDIVVGAGGTGAPGGQAGLSSGKGGDSSFNAIVALGGPAQNAGGGGAGQNGLVNPLVGSTLGELSGGKYYLGGYGARGMEGTTQTGTTGPGLGGGGGLERLPGTPNMGGGGGGSHVGYGGYPGGGPGGSGVVQVQYKGAAKFSGGTITTIGEGADLKTVHTFNASGRLAAIPTLAQYLIVGGGGAGGSTGTVYANQGLAGGAAGQVKQGTTPLTKGTTYNISIGAGGGPVAGANGTAGGSSAITGIETSVGGGGNSGGTGGTSGNGFAGGPDFGLGGGGGGGGGSTAAASGKNGGPGTTVNIAGTPYLVAGGGGGAGFSDVGVGAAGGGNGNQNDAGGGHGGSATANTGSGGGGASCRDEPHVAYGGSGGSGVVVMAIPTQLYSGVTTGAPTVTTASGYTLLKFIASGSYTH
jgi:hypothetical protein